MGGFTWTDKELRDLKKIYANSSMAKIRSKIHKSERAINCRAFKLGLKKSKKWMKKNKGSHLNVNRAHKVGAIAIWRIRGRDMRKMIKIRNSDRGWIPLQTHIWTKNNPGVKVPIGWCIGFKDGNFLNCFPSNLVLVPRGKGKIKQKKETKTAKDKGLVLHAGIEPTRSTF